MLGGARCALAKSVIEHREERIMDKDRVKGKLDDAAGRVKRQVGEWMGDTQAQVEGAAQQVKGKAENAWGKTKDAVRDAASERKSKDEASKDEARREQQMHDGNRKERDVA